MAALLNFEKCPSCSKYHDFYLPDEDMFSASGRYEFMCPETKEMAQIRPSTANKIVRQCPVDAVVVKRVDVQ